MENYAESFSIIHSQLSIAANGVSREGDRMTDTVQLETYVGAVTLADGNHDSRIRQNNFGDLIVSKGMPDAYEQVLRGNAFVYSTAAAGVTWLAPTGTQNMPMIWNPSGSGKHFVLERILAGYVSGTHVPGNLELAYLTSAGSQIGTGAPIVSLTQVAGVNRLLGAGNASVMWFAPATVTVTTAPTFLMTLGQSHATGAAATAMAPWVWDVDFKGALIVPPSVALFVVFNAVSTVVGSISIFGLEMPIPPTA
jgi:hypothetical protein